MRPNRLFRRWAVACAAAALTGCAGADRQVSPSASPMMERNPAGSRSAGEYSPAKLPRAFEKLDQDDDLCLTVDKLNRDSGRELLSVQF